MLASKSSALWASVSAPKTLVRTAAKLTSYSVASTIETTTPVLNHTPEAAHMRKLLPERTGLLARKVGMITWFNTFDEKATAANSRPAGGAAAAAAKSGKATKKSLSDAADAADAAAAEKDSIPQEIVEGLKSLISQDIIGGGPGQMFPCTVLEVDRCQVTHIKTLAKDGYCAVQVGISDVGVPGSPNNEAYIRRKFTRAQLGHFARAEVAPKNDVAEFLVKNDAAATSLPLGTLLDADHFAPGQYVDLKSVSKGKGFQGVMKRHGFHGMSASHGNSLSHRSAGSTGMNQDPGRVLPGKKMPGHMGFKNVTIQNTLVIGVDKERGYILVKGPVAGPNGAVVKISDAKKKLPEYLGLN
ncbi:mitochondrial 54S ribosomal protein uL3m [Magnusiomyces paraingens]|uniref:Large ribosomal subunit protein uL3m n=1 Tax=Magnusiomyces paraingens TaxID=2606893 RepID=A0A5E8C6W8_9ASCO|nr:uncharacterized protein SAPINGB_P005413 [Saprochaete ingens]VVT56926.1 unnamed protein product [Saprochaete ingens]